MIKIPNLKDLISGLVLHSLFASSMTMIVGSNLVNVLNYIYHLLMGRLLGPAGYGELAALLSLVGLVGMIPTSLGLVIIKFTSAAKDTGEIRALYFWFNKKIFYLSLTLFILIVASSSIIASFLNIRNALLVSLAGSTFIFTLPALLNRSILQGALRFRRHVLSMLAENVVKLGLGGLVVFLGFSVLGSVSALVAAAFIGWVLSRHFIRDYILVKFEGNVKTSPIFSYSVPILIQSLSLASLYTADLVMVKHFFSPHQAGLYAALSTLARIIFFGAGPIGAVMFPMVSQRYSQRLAFKKIFIFSLVLTLALSSVVLMIYWLVPKLAINILYGSLYLEAAPDLLWLGLSITAFTLSSLFINFHLSLGQTKVVTFPLVAALAQVLGIWIYHDSLRTVINVSIVVNSLLLGSLLVYFAYASKINFNYSTGLQTRKNYRQKPAKNKEDTR